MGVGPEDIERRPPLLPPDLSRAIKNTLVGITLFCSSTCIILQIIRSFIDE